MIEATSTDFLHRLESGLREDIVRMLYRSVVAVSGITAKIEANTEAANLEDEFDTQIFYESGYLVRTEDPVTVAYVTAGHVLNSIRLNCTGDRKLCNIHLHDRGPVGLDCGGVPIRKEMLVNLSSYTKEGDCDCAAILIPPFEANAILAGGEVDLVDKKFIASPDEGFDAYFLLGFPVPARASVTVRSDRNTLRRLAEYGCLLLGVTPVANPRPNPQGRCRFIAKIDLPDDPKIADICGMSGGPIWGLRCEGGGYALRLVATQSSWLPSKKYIFAEYTLPFVEEMEESLRNTIQSQEIKAGGPIEPSPVHSGSKIARCP